MLQKVEKYDKVFDYREGYDDGYEDGKDDGFNEGHSEGYDLGYGDGKEDGFNEGYDEGENDSLFGPKDNYDEGYEDGQRYTEQEFASELEKFTVFLETLQYATEPGTEIRNLLDDIRERLGEVI